MQETKVLELVHYNPVMTSAMITEQQKKGWKLHSVFCTNTKYKYNPKQLLKNLQETAQQGHFKEDMQTALAIGVRPKGCIFTIFLTREVQP